jgi:1-aminocyclopropane-1-carboxylate deaminase/D-cysteine desulfhydrase-like pyridoxal-dependent ACC family enzyme
MAMTAGRGRADAATVGAAGAPRFPLAILPTPLVRAGRLERALRCPPLYVKRDDMSGFALGGNKVRKLEYLIGEARLQGCDTIVTGGGPGSNHCMTTAAAARVAGMACELVLFGTPPAHQPAALTLARRFGAHVRFTGDDDRSSVDRQVPAVADEQRARHRTPYVVPRGGATPTGSLAYAQACAELAAQVARHRVDPEVLLVATGSCGTQAGLVAGTIACGAAWRVVGASVSRPVDECVSRIGALARACTDRLGVRPPRTDEVTVKDARGPGFGRPSDAGRRSAALAADTEGILLDPVYTAKALAELPHLRDVTGPIVFWHTGGLASAIAAGADPAPRPSP